ncbi:MAG TPA: response regulator, partial [Bacteroidales bacterium]|nr:response regulator [Bacteroidales bacterium]
MQENFIAMKEQQPIQSKQLLYHFLQKQNAERDVYHDLMPFKVKEILLIATLYDAFSIEREGRFVDEIFGEFHQLNLISLPRITGVSTKEEVLEQLAKKQFDLVIIIAGMDKSKPKLFSKIIKQNNPLIPIYLLLNNNKDIHYYSQHLSDRFIERTFVWNGDSSIFLAMVKHLEDRVNVENDTKTGIIKVVLLVEDSEKYYSRYLPVLYHVILEQTRRIITEVKSDELYKILRLRARPRVILVSNYEDAVRIAQKYEKHLLALITDVKFMRNGVMDKKAGFELTRLLRSRNKNLPVIIQSSDNTNRAEADLLETTFIDKNSQNLLQEIKFFLRNYLGFGKFIFRTHTGEAITAAANIDEFMNLIKKVPIDSLKYHGERNHFSLWLMAQGEITIAKIIQPILVTDFSSEEAFRNYLLYTLINYRNEIKRGRLVPFSEADLLDETNVVNLASGNLGGKGRGLVFINTLLYNINFRKLIKGIKIRMPRTAIIGTDEFELFLEYNNFLGTIYKKENSKINVSE